MFSGSISTPISAVALSVEAMLKKKLVASVMANLGMKDTSKCGIVLLESIRQKKSKKVGKKLPLIVISLLKEDNT